MTGNAFTSATSLGHGGRQDYGTPQAFVDIVARHWGPVVLDLAAHERNHKAPRWYGPGGEAEDALQQDWAAAYHDSGNVYRKPMVGQAPLLWLNPEFSHMAPWVRKCHEESRKGARIALLAPANVGAAWWWDYVLPSAHVLILKPRLAFDGAPVRGKEKDLAALCMAKGMPLTTISPFAGGKIEIHVGSYVQPPWSGFTVGAPNNGSLSLDPFFFEAVLGMTPGEIPKGFKALPFPGPLMLALYSCGDEGRLSRWAWQE